MRWTLVLVIAFAAASCGDDPDVYSLDGSGGAGGSGGSAGSAGSAGNAGTGGAADAGSDASSD